MDSLTSYAARATMFAVLWGARLGPTRLAVRHLARVARRALVALGDPLVPFQVGDITVEIPLSHELPLYRVWYPLYDTALARVAAAVARAWPGSSAIDVGANIGDTAALIRSASSAPILAIEGNPSYSAVLRRNADRIGNITLEHTLVGTGVDAVGAWSLETGTGRLVPAANGTTVRTERLEDIMARHPELPAPKLVKIDTDGFDCPIVEASVELWARWRPALFFEYVPDYYAAEWSPLAMFEKLRTAGYHRALVYDQFGEFLTSVPLADETLLLDLHTYFTGRYADMVLFHSEDRGLADAFTEKERVIARIRGPKIGGG